jgi:hypothetical protein
MGGFEEVWLPTRTGTPLAIALGSDGDYKHQWIIEYIQELVRACIIVVAVFQRDANLALLLRFLPCAQLIGLLQSNNDDRTQFSTQYTRQCE